MKRATRGETSIHVDAPPAQVYELISDITRMGAWSPETYRCEWLTDEGPVVGARFKGYNRRHRARWSNTLEVIAAHSGREFAFRREVLGCGVCDWRYRLEPAGAGTTLTESYEVHKADWAIVNWVNGLLLGVADRDQDLQEGMRTTLKRIKQAAEEASASAEPVHPRNRQRTDRARRYAP